MAEKDPKTITLTEEELEARLAARDKQAKMTPEEKAIREIVRDESESTVRKVLGEFFDMSEPAGENDGGGTAETFWTKLGKSLTAT